MPSCHSKYKSRKVSCDGITFDSLKEARRFRELRLLETAGEISDLQTQVKFVLMDDFYLIHPSKKYLKYCLEVITAYLETLELSLNGKTQIFPFKNGVSYLGFHTYITPKGKPIRKLKNQNKRNAQRKFLRMAKLVAAGKLSEEKFRASYGAWKNHISHGNCYKLGRAMWNALSAIVAEKQRLVRKEQLRLGTGGQKMGNKRLIDANALIFHLGEEPMVWSDGEAEIQERNDWRRFKACVEAQPTVDAAEVVHARWEQIGYDVAMDRITCSHCKEYWSIIDSCVEDFNYCPNCGAKMDGERKDNE